MKTSAGKTAFAVFPEFTKLGLEHRKYYERRVAQYPPVGDIQFPVLLTWWGGQDNVFVSELNGNLVIQYWRMGDEKRSGLALVGTSNVDESICTIFDYLRQIGEKVRLMNVPELTVSEIRYPELFSIKNNRWFDEYIVEAGQYYPLENLGGIRRRRVERSLNKFGRENICFESLDLNNKENQDVLINATSQWLSKGVNDAGRVGMKAYIKTIVYAEALGTKNICMYAGDELIGFFLYYPSSDGKYATLQQILATHKDTLGFELIAYLISNYLSDHGVSYVNIGEDMGDLRLRMIMMTFGPRNFFRKYEIRPAE